MKNFFAFVLLLIFSCHSGNNNDTLTGLCNYYGDKVANEKIEYSYQSSKEAEQIIQVIIDVIGLKPNFIVKSANVSNASAVIIRGNRYILYNPSFIESIDNATGNRWASISILAHEIGHHLNGHTLGSTGSTPELELEADEFSGFVLRKLGANLNDAQSAMKIAADIRGSHTHPPRQQRLIAIQTGWEHAGQQLDKLPQPAAEKITTIQPKKAEVQTAILDKKYIAYRVKFNIDPDGQYFVTIKNHLVKLESSKLLVLANMIQSKSTVYPYIFYQDKNNYLLIKKNGLILSADGKIAGYLTLFTS
jgi:hypothetical protein